MGGAIPGLVFLGSIRKQFLAIMNKKAAIPTVKHVSL